MSDKKYTLPGMSDWNFQVPQYSQPMLWHKGGAGFAVTAATTAQQIADGVKQILRQTTLTPDEAVFAVVAEASRNIDWQAMLKPAGSLVAPLLNAVPAAGQAISTELIDELCEHLKAVYFPLQKLKTA